MRVQSKVKKRIRVILICILICLVTACNVMFYLHDSKFTYSRRAEYLSDAGYARAFGVRRIEYDAFVAKYGEPSSIIKQPAGNRNANRFVAHYPDFSLSYVFWEWEPSAAQRRIPRLVAIEVKSASYRFGRQKIGVGSTRSEIHAAYASDPAVSDESIAYYSEYFPEIEEGYYGEDWNCVLFDYGSDEHVTAMIFALHA